MPILIEHIFLVGIILAICYYIFYRKETFINRRLENFNGDDLNIHKNDDLNIQQEEKSTSIE